MRNCNYFQSRFYLELWKIENIYSYLCFLVVLHFIKFIKKGGLWDTEPSSLFDMVEKNNWNWIIWEKSQNYSLFKWYICFLFACLFQHIHILISTFGLLHMVFIYFFNWSIVDLQCCVKYQVVLQSDSLYIYAFFSDYFPL